MSSLLGYLPKGQRQTLGKIAIDATDVRPQVDLVPISNIYDRNGEAEREHDEAADALEHKAADETEGKVMPKKFDELKGGWRRWWSFLGADVSALLLTILRAFLSIEW